MTCIASLVYTSNAELKLQEFSLHMWNFLHHSCRRCHGELTNQYGLHAIHQLKSAPADIVELLRKEAERVHMPHDDLNEASNLETRAPSATACTNKTAESTYTKNAEEAVGGNVTEVICAFSTVTKTTSKWNANMPSGALQQAGAAQMAAFVSDDELTNLLSVDEQHSMQSEVLQLSPEYVEMLGLFQSWCSALQSEVGTASIKDGGACMAFSVENVASEAGVQSSAIKATTMSSTQSWCRLQSLFPEIVVLSSIAFFFYVKSVLFWC